VQIIDNATKDDLTEVTLAQIIYEEQKQHSRSVPLQTLRDLIHQRGEKLMTQLREGPLGRLLPHERDHASATGVDDHETYGGTPAKDGDKVSEPKKTLLDQSREAFEGIQAKIDERVKSVLASFSPFQQLQSEVSRLSAKIEELEAKLKKAEAERGGPPKS
jgi:polyhydroxyalkanoate synthesis regulator protein